MPKPRNPGRVAGLWYLLLVLLGPLRLIYIPNKLFVLSDPAATVANISAHQLLFRFGIVADLAAAIVAVMLTLAFYRLFRGVDQHLAVLVVIFGGVMPALLYFVNVVSDGGALMLLRGPSFLPGFTQPQLDALVVLLLRLHNQQNTAAEMLWGVWLFPLGLLVYRSRFLPRLIGVWLIVNGFAYVVLCITGFMLPHGSGNLFLYFQPALMAEIALMLWLVIRGVTPPEPAQIRVDATSAVLLNTHLNKFPKL